MSVRGAKGAIVLLSCMTAIPTGGAAAQQSVAGQPQAPAWLGVSYDVRWTQSDSQCAPQVVLKSIVHGSPAERAGLRPGDAILAVDGRPVASARLAAIATALEPGDSLRLRVDRGGSVREVLAIAERRPSRPPQGILEPLRSGARGASAPIVHLDGETLVARNVEGARRGATGYWFATADGRTEFRRLGSWSADELDQRVARLLECAVEMEWQPTPPARLDLRQVQRRADSLRVVIARKALDQPDRARLELRARRLAPALPDLPGLPGAELTPLEPELAEYFRNVHQGLLVLRVSRETRAARGGLRPGDVIVEADGRRVESVEDLRARLGVSSPAPIQLRVVRKGRALTLSLPRP